MVSYQAGRIGLHQTVGLRSDVTHRLDQVASLMRPPEDSGIQYL